MPQALPVLGLDTLVVGDFATCLSSTVRDGVATLTFRCRPDVPDGVYSGVVLGDGLTSRLYAVTHGATRDVPAAPPQGCQHGKILRYGLTRPRRFGKAEVHADELVCVACGENRYQIYTAGGVHDGMTWTHTDVDKARARFEHMCHLHTRKAVTKPQGV